MASPAANYPCLPPELREGSSLRLLRLFGPGAIIACVTIGSGETVFASRGGAIFGYAMLWCFVAGAVCKGIQVYSAARFITLTGRHPLQSWMELPGPRGWFVWFVAVMTILWMPFWLAGLPKMLGEFTNWIVFPDWHVDAADSSPAGVAANFEYAQWGRYWGTLFLVVALTMTWIQTYGLLEKLQTAIVGLLLFCMVLAAAVSRPDWMGFLRGMIPQSPHYDPWVQEIAGIKQRRPWIEVMVYLGVIGGGAQDYFGYIGMMREKAWGMLGLRGAYAGSYPASIGTEASNVQRGRRWLRAPQIDVGLATLAILIFTICFVILGATTLHPKEIAPDGLKLLTEQATFLTELAGDNVGVRVVLDWTYKTGIFFAFFGTILGAFEIFTRTVHEAAIALFPKLTEEPLRTFRFWTLLWSGGGGFAILWISGVWFPTFDAVMIITPAALVGSGLICGLWCFAMIWSDRVHVPAALRMPWMMIVGLVIAGAVLSVGSSIGIWEAMGAVREKLAAG